MKKILIPFLSLCLIVFFSFTSTKKIVVIDAGHGGEDRGAVVDGISEKDLVLKIAQIIQEKNKGNKDVEIVLLRNDDTAPSLAERSEYIKKIKPNMVISLHMNHDLKNKDAKGKEVFVQKNEKSLLMGKYLARKFETEKVEVKDLTLLKNSEVPAVMLELGYLSNDEDRKYLTSEFGQEETAKKILEFLYEN